MEYFPLLTVSDIAAMWCAFGLGFAGGAWIGTLLVRTPTHAGE